MSEDDPQRYVTSPLELTRCEDTRGERALARDERVTFEDDYSSYVDETIGLSYDWEETLDPMNAQRARDLGLSSIAELEALDEATLDDVSLLFVARAWRAHGYQDEFDRILERLITGERTNECVRYDDLHAYYVESLLGRHEIQRAAQWLERLEARAGQARQADRLAALHAAITGDEGGARAAIDRLASRVGEDPEELFEVAQDMWRLVEHAQLARELLERVEQRAFSIGARAVGVDIALLRRDLNAAPHEAVSAALDSDQEE